MRLELTRSHSLAAALLAIGVLAGLGMFLTDLRWALAAPAAVAAMLWGAALARREWRRAPSRLVLRADGRVDVDGAPVEAFRIEWQGALACLTWSQAAHRQRRIAWPDVLDAATRRELRLWTLGRGVRASTAAVAP